MNGSEHTTGDVLFFFGEKTMELALYETLIERLTQALPEMTAVSGIPTGKNSARLTTIS